MKNTIKILCLILLTTFGLSSWAKESDFDRVKKAWCGEMLKLDIICSFPPREDVQVGDVYFLNESPREWKQVYSNATLFAIERIGRKVGSLYKDDNNIPRGTLLGRLHVKDALSNFYNGETEEVKGEIIEGTQRISFQPMSSTDFYKEESKEPEKVTCSGEDCGDLKELYLITKTKSYYSSLSGGKRTETIKLISLDKNGNQKINNNEITIKKADGNTETIKSFTDITFIKQDDLTDEDKKIFEKLGNPLQTFDFKYENGMRLKEVAFPAFSSGRISNVDINAFIPFSATGSGLDMKVKAEKAKSGSISIDKAYSYRLPTPSIVEKLTDSIQPNKKLYKNLQAMKEAKLIKKNIPFWISVEQEEFYATAMNVSLTFDKSFFSQFKPSTIVNNENQQPTVNSNNSYTRIPSLGGLGFFGDGVKVSYSTYDTIGLVRSFPVPISIGSRRVFFKLILSDKPSKEEKGKIAKLELEQEIKNLKGEHYEILQTFFL